VCAGGPAAALVLCRQPACVCLCPTHVLLRGPGAVPSPSITLITQDLTAAVAEDEKHLVAEAEEHKLFGDAPTLEV